MSAAEAGARTAGSNSRVIIISSVYNVLLSLGSTDRSYLYHLVRTARKTNVIRSDIYIYTYIHVRGVGVYLASGCRKNLGFNSLRLDLLLLKIKLYNLKYLN